jgi:hypothetical protein
MFSEIPFVFSDRLANLVVAAFVEFTFVFFFRDVAAAA